MHRMTKVVVGALLLAGLLAGCGVRGPLEPPPAATDAGDVPAAPGERPAHKPFVLDTLID